MDLLLIYTGVIYFVIFIAFMSAIEFDRIYQEVDFNFFQIIAAFFWPVIAIWYVIDRISNALHRRANSI